jgi:hypothetical protein
LDKRLGGPQNPSVSYGDENILDPTETHTHSNPSVVQPVSSRCTDYSTTAIILSVVLYGCETWSLTLRQEHGLRVLENSALKRVFGLRRNEAAGGWRTSYIEELHDFLREVQLK